MARFVVCQSGCMQLQTIYIIVIFIADEQVDVLRSSFGQCCLRGKCACILAADICQNILVSAVYVRRNHLQRLKSTNIPRTRPFALVAQYPDA